MEKAYKNLHLCLAVLSTTFCFNLKGIDTLIEQSSQNKKTEIIECDKNISKQQTFSKEELSNAIQIGLEKAENEANTNGNDSKNINGSLIEALSKVKALSKELSDHLSDYHVTGLSIAFDPNLALFFDWKNPEFDVFFKNKDGKTKIRKLHADIFSIGLRLELAFNIYLIFFINTDLNYLTTKGKIELGMGVDVGGAAFSLVYMPLKKHYGGLLLIGMPVGLSLGASIVTGGSLTPVK